LTETSGSGIRETPVKLLISPLCLWLVVGAFCSTAAAEIVSAVSSSKQFLAREIRVSIYPESGPAPIQTRMANSTAFLLVAPRNPSDTDETNIELQPSLLVVSCERLKGLFLAEMGQDDHWQGNVSMLINPALDQEKRPKLTANYFTDGWRYDLALPKTISTRLLVRVIIDTLLLEMANRDAGSHCAQIPFWLVEGMSAQLQSFNLPTYLLQPSEQMSGNRVKLKGLDTVREQLRHRTPLSFQELSWPTDADVDGPESELYRSCAQLFLEQLLNLKDGNRLLAKMLKELPGDLNWQTAFLSAFRPHFKQLLDVEKWWGLSAVSFAVGDLAEPLAAEDCGKELQDALDVPVQVHFEAEHMPAEAKLTLQEVITKWSDENATSALDRCIGQLNFLHLRASPEYQPLVDQYLKVLVRYLDCSHQPALQLEAGNRRSILNAFKSDAVRQLDALDNQRSARRHPARTTAVNTP
jgi:hypothetical protein